MAHQAEPVDIDCINSDFDNKENTFNHNNALPCTEKGYEELDVSELNMKLRYSVTPTSSPMSKSFTNCTDNRTIDSDDSFNYTLNESNLTRSLNSTMTKNDNAIKSFKTLPLQTISTHQKNDNDISEPAISQCNDITVTINSTSDIDDNVSLSSTTSSVLHTPEATTPTKEISKTDNGSPILRGLKSVFNMFRSSQSPITPVDTIAVVDNQETSTPVETVQIKPVNNSDFKPEKMASTPISTPRLKERNGSQRSSPYKDSIVFNDDLEKELQWKDETTIIFSHEKIPVHKLFFQQLKTIPTKSEANQVPDGVHNKIEDNLSTSVSVINDNESIMGDKTMTDIQEDIFKSENNVCNDSDSEFLDCETTFIKDDTITTDNVNEELKNENNCETTCINDDTTTIDNVNEELKNENNCETTFIKDNTTTIDNINEELRNENNCETRFIKDDITTIDNVNEELKNENNCETTIIKDNTTAIDNINEELRNENNCETTFIKDDITTIDNINEEWKNENNCDTTVIKDDITIIDNVNEELNNENNCKIKVIKDDITTIDIVNKELKNENNNETTFFKDETITIDNVNKELKNENNCETTFIKDDITSIDYVNEELKNENNCEDLNSDLKDDKTFNYYQDHLLCEVKEMKSALPVESVQISEQDESPHVLIDSLDVNVNENIFLTELKVDNILKEDKVILPLDNKRDINKQNISILKNNFENCFSTEYELDSLEHNLITDRINKLPTQEIKSDCEDNFVNNSNLLSPAEIPLPAEDDNELELNIVEMRNILSNNLLEHTIEGSTTVQCSIDETTKIKVISNVSFINPPLDDQHLIKKSEIIETLNTDIIDKGDEINTIHIQIEEAVNSPVENKDVNETQSLIENIDQLCSEFLDDLDTSRSCENKTTLDHSMDQCTSLDSLNENCMTLQDESQGMDMAVKSLSNLVISHETAENKTQLNLINVVEESILQGTITVLETKGNIENVVNDEQVPSNLLDEYKGSGDLSFYLENNRTFDYNQDHLVCEAEDMAAALPIEAVQNSEHVKSLHVMIDSLDVNVNKKQFLSEFKTEDILGGDTIILSSDNEKKIIIKEESGAKFGIENKEDSYFENKEENMSSQSNITKEIETIEIILDTDYKRLSEDIIMEVSEGQQINDKDHEEVDQILNLNITEAVQNMETNDSAEISYVSGHVESPDTLSDNITVEKSMETQNSIENTLNVGVTNYQNVSMEHVSDTALNEQQLDSIIQNESAFIKETPVNELPMNEVITSNAVFETNTTIKQNVVDYSNSQTMNEENHISNIIQEKLENINLETQELNIDKNLNLNTDNLDKDVDISELDTFTLEEEIVLSVNNSPYVSIAGDLDKLSVDQIPEAEDANTTITISSSPPIISKGYNFNFDEIEDPFSTKTNSQTSPTSEKNNQIFESKMNNINVDQTQIPKQILANERRKSQFGRRKPFVSNKKLNKTVSSARPASETDTKKVNDENATKKIADTQSPMKNTDEILVINNEKTPFVTRHLDKNDTVDVPDVSVSDRNLNILDTSEVNKSLIESTNIESPTAQKNISNSDQSSYYPETVPLNESIKSRNVFNLPEIDDINFNPFAVKSRLSQSPLPSHEDNPFITRSKLSASPENCINSCKHNGAQSIDSMDKLVDKNCEDKMETEPMEKGTSVNKSSDTCASITSEKNITVREMENSAFINKSSDTCLSDTSEKDSMVGEINTEDEDTVEGPFLDDLTNDDGDNTDMIKFNDIANQESEENAEGELFIDAQAFQFLLNQNRSNEVADSGKESLFLKFDPLFAKRISSDSVITALSKIQNRQSTPIKTTIHQNIMSATASSSTSNMGSDRDSINTMEVNNDNLNVTVSKPMMVVPPAVNAIATPRKSQTPTRTNRYSATFTSPAMAVIDRLLSLSANNSLVEDQSTFTQTSHEQNEANLALTQLREVLAEKEIQVYNLRSESKGLKDRLIVLESHMNTLEAESQRRLKKIEELTETLSKKTNMDRNMAVVFEEYESTIANLIAQIEKDKKQHAEERAALISERNEQTSHLTNMEVSFNDLHSKYEKIKQVIANYKANEEAYKKSLKMYEENFTKAQNNYELLKQHATSKLNSANEELQRINRAHEAEVLKMNAMIKRKDLHITSLEETLAQKTKANEELTAICDELINKVG